jgi:hypothetical protein
MPSCGRLAIGLAGFVPASKPITNRLQVANLPHGAPVCAGRKASAMALAGFASNGSDYAAGF